MQNKFKKMLLSIGTLATVAMPISAVVSCGSGTSGATSDNDDSTSGKKLTSASQIMHRMLEERNYALGDDTKDPKALNEIAATITDHVSKFAPYLSLDAKQKDGSVNSKFAGTLKEEWNAILPGEGNKLKREGWAKAWKDFKMEYMTLHKKNSASFEKEEGNFEKDYMNENKDHEVAFDDRDLKEKDYIGKYNTPFPSHFESPVVQLIYADKILSKTFENETQKHKAIIDFVYTINKAFTRRSVNVPGKTGSGYMNCNIWRNLIGFSASGYKDGQISKDKDDNYTYKGKSDVMPSFALMIAYGIEIDKKTLTDSQKTRLLNKDGSRKIFKDVKVGKFLEKFMDDFTTQWFYKGQSEFDNWFTYEVNMTNILAEYFKFLDFTDLKPKIKKWAEPLKYFAGDPLVQHSAETSIYNASPSVASINTGANLMSYIKASLAADLAMDDMELAKKHLEYMYDDLFKNYTGKYNDNYKLDGGFIQHNVVPYQGNYGYKSIVMVSDVQKLFAGTDLAPFNDPRMQNVFRIIADTYIPLIYQGSLSMLTQGRTGVDIQKDFPYNWWSGKPENAGRSATITFSGMLKYCTNVHYKKIIANFIDYQVQHDIHYKYFIKEDENGIQLKTPAIDADDHNIKLGSMIPLTQEAISSTEHEKSAEQQGMDMSYKNYIVKDYRALDELFSPGGVKQIWSNDLVIIDHQDENKVSDWRYETRFHDTRVALYESLLGRNTQGFYMGDGMNIVKTRENSQMFNTRYWMGIDPYHLPGTVSFTPYKIPDPDKYYVKGYSQHFDLKLPKANYNQQKSEWEDENSNVISEVRLPNEWTQAKDSSWVLKIGAAKTDAGSPGFSGGVNRYGYSNSMTQMQSFDQSITQQRSVISLGDMVLTLGNVSSPDSVIKGLENSSTNLTIDNRLTHNSISSKGGIFDQKDGTDQYGNAKFTKISQEKLKTASEDGQNAYDGYVYHDDDTKENIGYVMYDGVHGEGNSVERHHQTYIQGDANKEFNNNPNHYQPGTPKSPSNQFSGTFNRLDMKLTSGDTFAYSIVPNADATKTQEVIKTHNIKIIQNDQDAQIVSYTDKDGNDYLFANIFQNNNYATSVAWTDPNTPMILRSTKPTSMIFKRSVKVAADNNKEPEIKKGTALTKEQRTFELTAQDAIHDGQETRVGFGKPITDLTIPWDDFLLFKEQEDPQYWTDKEKEYQNGKFVDDREMFAYDWFKHHTSARIETAFDQLQNVGERFYRPDQLLLIPDSRFEVGPALKATITFEDQSKV